MLRALIVDDEPLLCQVYQRILETLQAEEKIPPLTTTSCKNYEAALAAIDRLSRNDQTLDFCVLDFRLSRHGNTNEKNGLGIGLLVKRLFPDCKILMITAVTDHYSFHSILESLKPTGFLIKSDTHLEGIKRGFCAVLDGETVYSKKVSAFIKQVGIHGLLLDDRDLELLHLMDKGYTLPEIGDKIGLSLSGIEYRKRKIANTIGADSSSIQDVLETAKNQWKLI